MLNFQATRIAIYVLFVETVLRALPELFTLLASIIDSIVITNCMAYFVGISAPMCSVCHPFIFAFSHHDFKEILFRRIARAQNWEPAKSGTGTASTAAGAANSFKKRNSHLVIQVPSRLKALP
ncbi:unnamed protein product [Gongylonema pulchrum]|uniref:G_PROTEIN_RECEP_F1_2 domain-containing protein n=1 Tax=Gongylonema pulchrum TaxID=637853 RepID=A0A183DKQ7_9BILA|nr:unnamed protein product [Gongylonema pulchrum]